MAVGIAALVGLAMFRRELRWSQLPASAADAAVFALLAGLAGAKGLWVLEHLGEERLSALVFSRGGLSWFGGLVGGLTVGVWQIRRRGLPLVAVLAAATPALAIGHAIGRVGCFLVGDDYGVPSDLPWAVAFPRGLPPTDVPVHPTQLYEAIALLPIAWLMVRWRRRARPAVAVLGGYFLLTGVLRFAIEFIRVNHRVALQLTVAQWASLGIVAAGVALLWRARGRSQADHSFVR